MSEKEHLIGCDIVNVTEEELLKYSPITRAAHAMLNYIEENGPIGLTKSGFLKRNFVHWAVDAFDWPGWGRDEVFCDTKVVDEDHFKPLWMLHGILRAHRLVRTYKGAVTSTKKGKEANEPALLFLNLAPYFMFEFDDPLLDPEDMPVGNWPLWLNVLNLKFNEYGSLTTEEIFEIFYGPQDWDAPYSWHPRLRFEWHVLDKLVGAGFLLMIAEGHRVIDSNRYSKSPLWRKALKLESDEHLKLRVVH